MDNHVENNSQKKTVINKVYNTKTEQDVSDEVPEKTEKRRVALLMMLLCLLTMNISGCSVSQKGATGILKNKRVINPWTWQDKYGFVQANEMTGTQRMLFCAGQISVNEEGRLLYPDDMEKQMNQIIDNMEVLLEQANFKFSNGVRFTYYTTDIDAFKRAVPVLVKRYKKSGCRPATSLIGVAALSHPGCVVEIEATFVD